jgi:putative phosphoesterase
MRVGLISDTHGLMRPQALRFLQGSDAIVHAGDIGAPEVLDALRAIAPLHAIRGNNDTADWASGLPDTLAVELGGVKLFVLHDFKALKQHPAPAGTQVVVCGHSHKPVIERTAAGFLLVNPGSAGPRRFTLPISAAELLIHTGGHVEPRIESLAVAKPAHPR